MNNIEKGNIHVYAAGGAGINVGASLEQYRGKTETGFATFDITYIDTSRSNLSKIEGDKHCYLVEGEGIDGSGKIRSENHEPIARCIRDVLQRFKPGSMNVVLSSGGGGSGSVIAPLLTAELLKSDVPTIVVMIGSTDTVKETENTLKTIKSYDHISSVTGVPVVMYYLQNTHDLTREEVNSKVIAFIMSLSILSSRENLELDTRDIRNWLRYDVSTSYRPQLTSVVMVQGNEVPSEIGNIISVATYSAPGKQTRISISGRNANNVPVLEYQCTGIIPEGIDKSVGENTPMHFVISDGLISSAASDLSKMVTEAEKQKNARIDKSPIVSANDKPSSTGLIL